MLYETVRLSFEITSNQKGVEVEAGRKQEERSRSSKAVEVEGREKK